MSTKASILEIDSHEARVIFLIHPEEEEIGVILDYSVGVTGEVALASELEPGPTGTWLLLPHPWLHILICAH